jgi:hypothetical protein
MSATELGRASTDDESSGIEPLVNGSLVSAHVGSGAVALVERMSSVDTDVCGSGVARWLLLAGMVGGCKDGDLPGVDDEPQKFREFCIVARYGFNI